MKVCIENRFDAEALAEFTAERGSERGWRDMSIEEIEALAGLLEEVGYKGDLYEFSDNYLINGDFIERPTKRQKEDALFCWTEKDGTECACMQF